MGQFGCRQISKQLKRKNAMEKHWMGNGQTLHQKNKKQWIEKKKSAYFS